MNFLLDAVVLLAYFALVMGIGLSQRSKDESVEGFALGDRQTPWWAVMASIMAAEISAATFLGAPGEGYANRNWTYVQLALGTVLARIIVSRFFIPLYYKLGVVSIYEYLGQRFGKGSRVLASATFLVTRLLAMGTRLYVSAIIIVIAIEVIYGQPVSAHTKFYLYAGSVIFVTIATTIYTALGGIKAVIWTDFIQVGVLVAALGFTIPFLLGKVGGWQAVSEVAKAPYFIETLPAHASESTLSWLKRLFSEEFTIYAALIASTFVTMATHGIDQDTVQRMLTAKNRKQSAVATILSGLIDIPVVSAFVLIGVLLSAFYAKQTGVAVPHEDREVFPYFIMTNMGAGLRGLVMAAVLSTAMGSLSTALNAMATSFTQDFLLPWKSKRANQKALSDAEKVRFMRWSTAAFAVLIMGVGVTTAWYMAYHPSTRIIPLVLGVMGYTFGSLLGLFLLALFTKTRGNDCGNAIAVVLGFIAVILASGTHVSWFYGDHVKADFVLAFPWRITLGSIVTFAVAFCFPSKKYLDVSEKSA